MRLISQKCMKRNPAKSGRNLDLAGCFCLCRGSFGLQMDMGSGLTCNAVLGFLQQGYERGSALLRGGKLNCCLNLGKHGAGGKLSGIDISLGSLRRQLGQPLNIRLAEVNGHLLHSGEDNQGIGIELLCQYAGGKVLVDDGICPFQMIAMGLYTNFFDGMPKRYPILLGVERKYQMCATGTSS